MEELLACRACLATDTKLFDMFNYGLVNAFENLTNTQMQSSDRLPRHICSYCSALLLKCAAFQSRCRTAQQLLDCILLQDDMLTTEDIRIIDRESNNLTLPLTVLNDVKTERSSDELSALLNIIEQKDEIKEENHDYETSSSSDEEPLAKIIKKEKRKRKLPDIETTFIEPYDDISIKEEDTGDGEYEEVGDKVAFDDLIDVITLSKEQQIADLQARRNSLNYKRSLYKCEQCFKGFMTKATCKSHMDRHDPQYGSFSCDVCQVRWASKKTLRSHINTTHAKNYVCRMCGHIAKSVTRAREHQKWHQGYTYVCDICGATFRKSTSHLTHVRLQHPSPHSCVTCRATFISSAGLQLHHKKMHSDKNGTTKLDTACSLCGLQFDNIEALGTHLAAATEGRCDVSLSPCLMCGESFATEDLLKEHARIHEEDTCFECNKKFANARVHATHYQEVHLGMKRKHRRRALTDWVCEVCGRQCMSKASLVYHQRTHTGEKPYGCTECSKRFSVLQRLQIHMRTHTDERPFKCSHCPKAFRHKAALNRHDRCNKKFANARVHATHYQEVHLGMKRKHRRRALTDWVCEVCGRQCMSKASLVYHQRTHTGEKPYGCTECSKRFSVLQRLQIHMRTHTDERPFKCSHCPKAFRHKAALNRHDRVHSGAKPYACPNCGKTFSQSNSMKTHVRTVHLKLPSLYRRAGKHKDDYSE